MKYFYSSFVITALGLLIAFFIGGFEYLLVCLLLGLLELSLSIDNAVVNANVLDSMDEKWRWSFFYFGLTIAVFGLRFFFPLALVALATSHGIGDTLRLALYDRDLYHSALEAHEGKIYDFGSGFLFDKEKDLSWIHVIEGSLVIASLKRLPTWLASIVVIAIFVIVSLGVTMLLGDYRWAMVILYFIAAALLCVAIKLLDSKLGTEGVRNGLFGFIYLELIDASFSFDGVLGAFALSNDIVLIMIGLGLGAVFVRSITLYLVAGRTLQKLVYLEHGAHYAIFVLAILLFLKVLIEVNEVVTGLLGMCFIAASVVYSLRKDKPPNG